MYGCYGRGSECKIQNRLLAQSTCFDTVFIVWAVGGRFRWTRSDKYRLGNCRWRACNQRTTDERRMGNDIASICRKQGALFFFKQWGSIGRDGVYRSGSATVASCKEKHIKLCQRWTGIRCSGRLVIDRGQTFSSEYILYRSTMSSFTDQILIVDTCSENITINYQLNERCKPLSENDQNKEDFKGFSFYCWIRYNPPCQVALFSTNNHVIEYSCIINGEYLSPFS